MTIAERITASGLADADLGRAIGRTRQAVRFYRLGTIEPPADVAARIERVLAERAQAKADAALGSVLLRTIRSAGLEVRAKQSIP